MEMPDLLKIKYFIAFNGFIWLLLLAVGVYQTNRSVLKRKGFADEYITFLRQYYLKKTILIAILLPVLELLSVYIFIKIFERPTNLTDWAIIVFILFLFVIPFKYLDDKVLSRGLKDLAINTKARVMVDLKHKTLHLIFVPYIEIILSFIYFIYSIVVLRQEYIVYFFILIPWLLYLTARGARYQNKPLIKETYIGAFILILINHIIALGYLLYRVIICIGSCELFKLVFGFIIAMLLISRIIYYLSNYPAFKSNVSGFSIQ